MALVTFNYIPVHVGSGARRFRQQGTELVRQIQQDRPRFEHPHRRLDATVEQGRDLRVGVYLDEATGELVALADADQPGIVLGTAVAQSKQFFKGNGDLDAIGRGQGIQLQRVLALRQVLVVRRACNREACEAFERKLIGEALAECEGNVPQAAQALGLGRSTLYKKMVALGL